MTNILLDAGKLDTDWVGDLPIPSDPYIRGTGTTLYLRSSPSPSPKPISKQSSDTIDSGTSEWATYTVPCLMSQTAGVLSVSNTDTYVEPGVAHYHHSGTWVSAPLSAQTVSGTVTVQLGITESGVATNSYPRIKIYKWLANDTYGSDLLALTTSATESNILNTHTTATFFLDATITETTFSAGDKIVIEIEVYSDNALVVNQTNVILFDGPGAEYLSYIKFSQTIIFANILLQIGGREYPFLVNTLNIDNTIGSRGIANFQIWGGYEALNTSRTGIFQYSFGYIVCNNPAPSVGTRIVFTSAVLPAGITAGTIYYIVTNKVLSGYNVIQVSATAGGTPIITSGIYYGLVVTWDEYTPYSFSIGENVKISNDGDLIWSGVIDRINKKLPSYPNAGILYSIQCVSWNYALDKRRIVHTYTSTSFDPDDLTCGNIVDDIIDKYLGSEGISTGVISSGVELNSAVFNYIKPSQILETLCEQSGYIWQINPDKTLDFKPHDSTYFGFNIGSSQMKHNSIQYIEGSPKYRNTQYVVGGFDLTDSLTEVQYGDSTKQAFVISYPLMQVPAVTANGTTKTVGILGIDTTQEWFWNKFSNIVSQNASDTPLSAAQKLSVVYVGGFPSVAKYEDVSAIATLRSNEGGSGLVEDAILKNKDSLYTDNLVLAENLIDKYSTICDTLQFRTLTPGITPGKILKIDLPDFSLSSEEFLVNSVRVNDEEGDYLWYDVNCVSGYDHGGWSNFFDSFLTRTVEKDIWAGSLTGDIVLRAFTTSETFVWTEATTDSAFLCPLCSSSNEAEAGAGTGLYPTSSNEVVGGSTKSHYPC